MSSTSGKLAVETAPTIPMENSGIANFLTFDIEDWFHILDLHERQSTPAEWHSFPSRLESNIDRILELLSERGVYATFFVLGWVAEKYPSVVKKLDSLGHEIACHGYGHDLITGLTREQLKDDIHRARVILEDLTGKAIGGYRGPGFSITMKNLWAFDVIAEEGFAYDATLYPGLHGHGGIPRLPADPFRLRTLDGHLLEEFPVTIIGVGKHRLAFSGGGYFRLVPFPVMTALIKRFNRRGRQVMMYIHPRDIDAETPRLPMPLKRRFKCYVNLSGSHEKLRKILARHAFSSISVWRNDHGSNSWPTISLKDL